MREKIINYIHMKNKVQNEDPLQRSTYGTAKLIKGNIKNQLKAELIDGTYGGRSWIVDKPNSRHKEGQQVLISFIPTDQFCTIIDADYLRRHDA